MTGEVIPFQFKQEHMRFNHEMMCRGCGQHVFCAVHWGPIDLCHTCQMIGPGLHREFLARTEREPPR